VAALKFGTAPTDWGIADPSVTPEDAKKGRFASNSANRNHHVTLGIVTYFPVGRSSDQGRLRQKGRDGGCEGGDRTARGTSNHRLKSSRFRGTADR